MFYSEIMTRKIDCLIFSFVKKMTANQLSSWKYQVRISKTCYYFFREEDEIENMTDEEMTEKMQINELGAIFDSKTGKRRYDNYQILRVNPDTDEHLDVLQFLEKGTVHIR